MVTRQRSCGVAQCSSTNTARHVESQKRESKKEDGKLWVLVSDDEIANAQYGIANDSDNGNAVGIKELLEEKDKRIAALESQLRTSESSFAELLVRFQELQREAADSRTRCDSIIMQLSKTLEKQQMQLQYQTLMIEDLRHPKSFWQRLFGASQTAKAT